MWERRVDKSLGVLNGEPVFVHHSMSTNTADADRYESWGYTRTTVHGPESLLSKTHFFIPDSGGIREEWVSVTRSPSLQPAAIALRPGESFIDAYTMTEKTTKSSSSSELVKTVSQQSKIEFLGIEDVTLGDGTVVRNACKIRSTDLVDSDDPGSVGSTEISWLAAGWGGSVREENYDKTGKLRSTETIVQVITAP